MGKTSDLIDQELAAAAVRKRRDGGTPNGAERAALRRVENRQEEDLRRAYYGSVPKRHYVELSGRQAKVINQQADRYGLPLRGRTLDLRAVLTAFHDFLAENARKLLATDDPMLGNGDSPALERYRAARADMVELELQERRRVVLPREEVRDGLERAAGIVRGAGNRLKRKFGPEAQDILNEALDATEREFGRMFCSEGLPP